MLSGMINSEDTAELFNEDELGENSDVICLRSKDESEEAADEESDEEEEEEEEEEALREKTVKSLLRSRPCSVCVYLCLMLFLLASVVSLIVMGILIVGPYRRVSNFKSTWCVVLGVKITDIHLRCSCGKGCSSTHICVSVSVQFTGNNDRKYTSTMYENESMLNRKVSI